MTFIRVIRGWSLWEQSNGVVESAEAKQAPRAGALWAQAVLLEEFQPEQPDEKHFKETKITQWQDTAPKFQGKITKATLGLSFFSSSLGTTPSGARGYSWLRQGVGIRGTAWRRILFSSVWGTICFRDQTGSPACNTYTPALWTISPSPLNYSLNNVTFWNTVTLTNKTQALN